MVLRTLCYATASVNKLVLLFRPFSCLAGALQGSIERDAADAASSAENITSDPSKIDSAAFQEATQLILEAQQIAKTNRTVRVPRVAARGLDALAHWPPFDEQRTPPCRWRAPCSRP